MGADEGPDGRLAAGEAVFGDQTLPDPPGGMALLVVDRLVRDQPGHDERGDRVHDRGGPSPRAPVRPGPGILEGPADRRPAVVEGSGELSDARPFPEVGVPDTLDVDHLDQPFLQDGCGFNNRHRTGWLEGQGGPALVDHSAPGWVRFTLSLAGLLPGFGEGIKPVRRAARRQVSGLVRPHDFQFSAEARHPGETFRVVEARRAMLQCDFSSIWRSSRARSMVTGRSPADERGAEQGSCW